MTTSRQTIVVLVAISVLALVAIPLLWSGAIMGGMMGPGMMGRWASAPAAWCMASISGLLVLLLAGIGLLIAWAVRQAGSSAAGGDQRALEILKERYARGELTREQYEQMRHDLEH